MKAKERNWETLRRTTGQYDLHGGCFVDKACKVWCLCGFSLEGTMSNFKIKNARSKQICTIHNNFPIRIPNSYPPPERLYRLSNSPHRACGHLVWQQLMDSTPGNYCHRTFSPGGRTIQYSRVVLSARTCSRYNIRALAHSSITIPRIR